MQIIETAWSRIISILRIVKSLLTKWLIVKMHLLHEISLHFRGHGKLLTGDSPVHTREWTWVNRHTGTHAYTQSIRINSLSQLALFSTGRYIPLDDEAWPGGTFVQTVIKMYFPSWIHRVVSGVQGRAIWMAIRLALKESRQQSGVGGK